MIKFAKIACLLALCSGIAMGCGDDDDDGSSGQGCYSEDFRTCDEGSKLVIETICSIEGELQACPTAGIQGTCDFDDYTTTYYKEENGDPWDGEADAAKEDCEDGDGKYTAK
jgi:hypothetical protein